MPDWEELDDCLDELCQRLGAQAYVLSDTRKAQLSPGVRHPDELIARFEQAYQILQRKFGPGFLRKGTGKHWLHQGAHDGFAAEVLLGTYLLLLLFGELADFFKVRRELDQAKPLLEALVEGLPPLGGGGRLGAKGGRARA
ncbi:MAG: hypothetical protein HY744_06350 [Deltaproteobacteria bacterium]|nr:hypothetical protein [Deltaproteobacteria bacterium]